ncbi:MAG: hypothetical protein F4X26_03615 [Chloroflexi bacterium]|nr:hypothetical protein [Chloroflexota bacterium]MYD65070.1 hypothetical protein [Chloroflexota bacterium]
MNSPDTGAGLGQLVDRLGSMVLFLVVGVPAGWYWIDVVWVAGIDNLLHMTRITNDGTGETAFVRPGIEFVVIPFAAAAAVALRWGVDVFEAPVVTRSLWLPLLGTTAVCTLIWLVWVESIVVVVVPFAAIAAGVLREATQGRGPGAPPPRAMDERRKNDTPWLPWLAAAVWCTVMGCLLWSWVPPRP